MLVVYFPDRWNGVYLLPISKFKGRAVLKEADEGKNECASLQSILKQQICAFFILFFYNIAKGIIGHLRI